MFKLRREWCILVTTFLVVSILLPQASALNTSALCLDYGKPLREFSRFLEVEFIGDSLKKRFSGLDTIYLAQLPSGTYEVTARWMSVEVGRWVVELSEKNIALNLELALTDVSFEVRDLEDKPLRDIVVEISPAIFGRLNITENIISIRVIPTTLNYLLKIYWKSPIYKQSINHILQQL
ncbi:MAG: hypothetical protein ABDH32_01365 [Candidatus Caldarchaeales archaeon]